MTRDEMDIETYRYRAPTVVPLACGRFAVLGPKGPTICETANELYGALMAHIEWNALGRTCERDLLKELGL